jgi:predicted RNA binding protein YcfA (HicA-like mRNA interferase family)
MQLMSKVSGKILAKRLERYGYELSWRTGSHLICTVKGSSTRRITIPTRNPLRIGTVGLILTEYQWTKITERWK